MAYDLQRLSVLVVDDNDFARSLLADVLMALKVGQIWRAKDGAEAIKFLAGGVPGQSPADLVFTDLMMPQLDGMMLLRWIRLHPESPDRFLPVVVLSGVVDPGRLRQCRNLGATEILAKPFSIGTIISRLTSVIEHPRPYVQSLDYFGPDRRRMDNQYPGSERRVMPADKIVEVRPGQPPPRRRRGEPGAPVTVYRLPNRLRDKVLGIGGTRGFDPMLVKLATEAIIRREDDYADWVMGSVQRLHQLLKRLAAGEPARPILKEMNAIAHELRGQGTTFGYPLVTLFCQSLFEFTGADLPLDMALGEDEQTLLKAHVDGVQAVLGGKVKGDGGPVGKELRHMLTASVARYKAQTSASGQG